MQTGSAAEKNSSAKSTKKLKIEKI